MVGLILVWPILRSEYFELVIANLKGYLEKLIDVDDLKLTQLSIN